MCNSGNDEGEKTYPGLGVRIRLTRHLGFHLTQTYIPRFYEVDLIQKECVNSSEQAKQTRNLHMHYVYAYAHRDIRTKNFPFLYEDGPRAVMGVKQ